MFVKSNLVLYLTLVLFCMFSGGRMFYNTQDMLWRRKLEEEADLQQALELQSRRLMGLQLLDVKKHHQRALSTGSPIPSPTHSLNMFNQNLVLPSFHNISEAPKGIYISLSFTFEMQLLLN